LPATRAGITRKLVKRENPHGGVAAPVTATEKGSSVLKQKRLTEAVNSVHISQARDVPLNATWLNQPLLTLKQAAIYAICTPRYLQNQIRSGRLKALKPTGKLLRIRRSDLEKFLESGATVGGGE